MKILLIIDSLGSGGAERSTADLADFLFKNDIQFEIVCLYKKEIGVQSSILEKNYSINFLPSKYFLINVIKLSTLIKNDNIQIVHSTLFKSNLLARFSKLFTKFIHIESLVSTTYSKERFEDGKVNTLGLKVYKFIDRLTANRFVDHFHSISDTVKEHYIRHLRLSEKSITVIYRGRKPNPYIISKEPINGNNNCEIINVGRHEFAKGQIFILMAIKILRDLNYNFNLKIYGRNGNETNNLQNYIENNNLKDCVSLEGFNEDIPKCLSRSDIFIFASLYEGLGGALIEAQAAGLPIACNNLPVFHEIVDSNINAKFFDTRNVNTIVNSVKYFLDSKEDRKKFGENGLENFKKKFNEDENNSKILELYRKLSYDKI